MLSSFRCFFRYISFLIKSKNQHGVHSPFVYDYLTKGIYAQQKKRKSKREQWLYATLHYFQPKFVFLYTETDSKLLPEVSEKVNDIESSDCIICESDYFYENSEQILSNLKNNQLLLVSVREYDKIAFDSIRHSTEVRVVVDFFYGVLISNRLEQQKQNFFLRM